MTTKRNSANANYVPTRIWKETVERLKKMRSRAIKRRGENISMPQYLDEVSKIAEKLTM